MEPETMLDRIMFKLQQRGETPGFMCNTLGIRRALITDMKTGKTETLSAKYIAMIADYLHVTCDYLIRGTEPYASLPPTEIALLNAWRLSSETEKENVAFILRNHDFIYTPRPAKAVEEKLA